MTNEKQADTAEETQIEQGTYELIRDRLVGRGKELSGLAHELNERRLGVFGGSELAVIGNVRIRTEHNCVPRDIAQVGDQLLFGYNVFVGLKKQTELADVFCVHQLRETESGFELEAGDAAVIASPEVKNDFDEIYSYYKEARLLQLRNTEGALLAIFRIGATVHDIKVLRWALSPDGVATYRDNRGERDHTFSPAHDFEWTATSREQHVQGKNPHVDILGEVFVETVGGDLTVKIENNTEDGLGIYREPVEDGDQALDDGEIHYAKLGTLILLKVLPYRETEWRYFVFNTRSHTVHRIDAIGQACQQLPEDHGIIFPGGYYLRSGETKSYDNKIDDLEFVKRIRSPNGEDVLYVFHHREDGTSLLLPYNLIRKDVANPIACHGYCIFQDGKMIVFRSTSDEPTRVHPMQIWQTPFFSDEFALHGLKTGDLDAGAPALENIGNAELVRGISDAYSLQQLIARQEPSLQLYEDLILSAGRMLDNYHWLDDDAVGFSTTVRQIRETAELIVDEFEKVETLRSETEKAVDAMESEITETRRTIRPDSWSDAQQFVAALGALRSQRGRVISLRDMRYVDRARLDELESSVVEEFDRLSTATVDFLGSESAFGSYHERTDAAAAEVQSISKVSDADTLAEEVEAIEGDLQLLSDIATGLRIEDATVRAALLEEISGAMAGINRARALLVTRRKELRSGEATAEFGAEFKLFGQTTASAINAAGTPEECDAALTRLMVALEDLESRYADFDEFLAELQVKREETYEAVNSKRQRLLDEQQRRITQLAGAADRVLDSVRRRARSFGDLDQLNGFFAGDPMVAKARDFAEDLRALGDGVKADELSSKIKSAQQEATRALRDRTDLFEGDDDVIRLGRHRFSVNSQELELTLVPRASESGDEEAPGGSMALHLVGTDFFEPVTDDNFLATRPFWQQMLVSEDSEMYRGEYLASSILALAEEQREQLSLDRLHMAMQQGELLALVRAVASERYDEGYDRGVHDADAAKILEALLSLTATAGTLRFPGDARALALFTWHHALDRRSREALHHRALSLSRLEESFGPARELGALASEMESVIAEYRTAGGFEGYFEPELVDLAASYLLAELGRPEISFAVSGEALDLTAAFRESLRAKGRERELDDALRELDSVPHRFGLLHAWLSGFSGAADSRTTGHAVPGSVVFEATAVELLGSSLVRRESHALPQVAIEGMLGQHPRISESTLRLRLDELTLRAGRFRRVRVPAFREYQKIRHRLLGREAARLRLDEFKPRVLSSFVRNRLLDEVYLPLIGDNLAKQIGALGDGQRTDLMGLLLLISPPGYGKTTLMEYVANRLGLVFMKINGPALGHSVTSLDPEDAPSATARQEVEKINLAFEMANNVLLYIDDIQHTSSEFLQKFISLCDAQRRVEGVWKGRTRTYDLRGKKFAVCMAGNPYTESGARFEVPDMLANRADTYNLGDVLEGRDDLFALSYVENSLTSNSILAPLSGRDPDDVHKLIAMAKANLGDPEALAAAPQSDQLTHPYSAAELGEIRSVLEKLLRVQEVVLRVNREYIDASSKDDAFRTEPKFQLQGSYRNMNRLAERIVPAMNREELEGLIDDHYIGEAQTLTSGAEHNTLKLKQLRGTLSESEAARWEEICRSFARVQATGGQGDDPVTRMTGTIGLVSDRLHAIQESIEGVAAAAEIRSSKRAASSVERSVETAPMPTSAQLEIDLDPYLERLQQTIDALAQSSRMADGVDRKRAAPAEPSLQTIEALGQQVGRQVSQLTAGLQAIGTAIEMAGEKVPQAQTASSQVQIVQTLRPGVYQLMDELSTQVEDSLMELLRDISRWLKRSENDADPRIHGLLDRTLSGLDRFKDLLEALQRIDTQGLASGQRPDA